MAQKKKKTVKKAAKNAKNKKAGNNKKSSQKKSSGSKAKKIKKAARKITGKVSAKKTTKSKKKSLSKKSVAKKITAKKKTVAKRTNKPTPKKTVKKAAVSSKKQTNKVSAAQKSKTTTAAFVPHTTSLQPGMKSPYFEGLNQHGTLIRSTDFSGKKIILYFYPKDDTPGCTAEACSLRDDIQSLSSLNMEVIGVSADSVESHKKFAEKYNLPFHLISDPDKKIISAFDVWGKKQFMGKVFEGIIRTTFIINENGIIEHVIKDVNTKEHAQQIRELLGTTTNVSSSTAEEKNETSFHLESTPQEENSQEQNTSDSSGETTM